MSDFHERGKPTLLKPKIPEPHKPHYEGILGKLRKAIDRFKAKVNDNEDTRPIDKTEEPTTNPNDYVAEEEEESEIPFEFLEDHSLSLRLRISFT